MKGLNASKFMLKQPYTGTTYKRMSDLRSNPYLQINDMLKNYCGLNSEATTTCTNWTFKADWKL
jgi:hypothetical protein